jgi:peptide/nickel transport system substrate-binding protein
VASRLAKGFVIVSTCAVAAAGAALSASAAPPTTLRVDLSSGLDSADPALAYYGPSWQMLDATCLKLLNYSDAAGAAGERLVPEAALTMPTVSSDGLTYTLRVRSGLRMSPPSGERVNAQTFAHELDRVFLEHSLAALQFTEIAGSQAMLDGGATHLSGVVADRLTLSITLTRPDADFPTLLATPWTCAVPRETPSDSSGVGAPLASGGPYYLAQYVPNQRILLKRNANYRGHRPAGYDRILYTIGQDQATAEQQVSDGTADYMADGVPPLDQTRLYDEYGPGHDPQQFFVTPQIEVDYLALNTSRPTFAQANVRKAVNYAIDRQLLMQQRGPLAGTPSDQVLPPGMPGYHPVHRYPLDAPDIAKARALMRGERATIVLYTCNTEPCTARAAAIQQELSRIHLTVQVVQFSRAEQIVREGTRGEPFDIADEGWGLDYPDPYDFFHPLLDGKTIQATGNTDLAYLDDPVVSARIAAANSLSGAARRGAWAALDRYVTDKVAPLAVYDNRNQLDFVSANIQNEIFQPIYGLDLAALEPRAG